MSSDCPITVSVKSEFIADKSNDAANRWFFAYHITISNHGEQSARLLTRHWVITDGKEQVHEVHGDGVVGQQPDIAAGDNFSYSSGAVLETAVGSMYGSYQMLLEDGTILNTNIPAFTLAPPHAIH